MKDDKTDRPEPFTSIMELTTDYSHGEILEELRFLAAADAQNEEYCSEYRGQQAWIAIELAQLLTKYHRRCQEEKAIARVGQPESFISPGAGGVIPGIVAKALVCKVYIPSIPFWCVKFRLLVCKVNLSGM